MIILQRGWLKSRYLTSFSKEFCKEVDAMCTDVTVHEVCKQMAKICDHEVAMLISHIR